MDFSGADQMDNQLGIGAKHMSGIDHIDDAMTATQGVKDDLETARENTVEVEDFLERAIEKNLGMGFPSGLAERAKETALELAQELASLGTKYENLLDELKAIKDSDSR